MEIRKLTLSDYEALKKMDTGIDDDYVVRIFPMLIESKDHTLYGLFDEGELRVIAGSSLFERHYAVLGRLRTDRRFQGKGYATAVLKETVKELESRPDIHWIGAMTHMDNKSAVRVTEKLGLNHQLTYHSITLDPHEWDGLLNNSHTPWEEIVDADEKKAFIHTFSPEKTELGVFPYEGYYPLPLPTTEINDAYLEKTRVFKQDDRFVMVSPDQKGEAYLNVKYFSNDHFEQPGLWETILPIAKQEHRIIWIDVKPEALEPFKKGKGFHIQSPWGMFGKWLHTSRTETSVPEKQNTI